MDTQTPGVFGTFVHVTDAAGVHHAFKPGDPVPGWARPLVGDHVLEEPDTDSGPEEPDWPEGAFTTETGPVPDGNEKPAPPPTSGAGSSRPAWAEFARQVGQPVPDVWSRQDIIDALIRNGHLRE